MLAERMKKLRKQRGIYQRDLADHLNVDVTTVTKYENGQRKPGFDTLINIADFYGVDVDYLLGRSDTPRLDQEWFNKLPQQIKDLVSEHNIQYLEIARIAKDKEWSKEEIKEVAKFIEKIADRKKS